MKFNCLHLVGIFCPSVTFENAGFYDVCLYSLVDLVAMEHRKIFTVVVRNVAFGLSRRVHSMEHENFFSVLQGM